jgi:2-polyprenyl-3-methyl-5-hydroxy-6-metoxy-1,4-benzoquinol methylase
MSLQQYRHLKIKAPKRRGFVPSPELIYERVLEHVGKLTGKLAGLRHLDVGAGSGLLLRLMHERFGFEQRACDHTNEFVKYSDVTLDIVDLDREPLPYHDAEFDLVTCVETIEHVENFRGVMREIYRVLKPGGFLIISTPNILNLR